METAAPDTRSGGNTRPPPTARRWTFTENKVENIPSLKNGIRCVIWQLEEKGHKHFQGYLETTMPRRKAWLIKNFSGTAHYEISGGTREENRKYCTKPETRIDGPWELGDWTEGGQGARNDLKKVALELKTKKIKEVAADNPETYIKYHKGMEKLRQHLISDRNWATEVHIIWGAPGSGKTRKVYEENKDIYSKPDGQWWDGYDGHEIVLIDDFDGINIPYETMLKICDRYPLQLACKGGFVNFVAKKIYITSNINPDEWWLNRVQDAFKRRITSCEKK